MKRVYFRVVGVAVVLVIGLLISLYALRAKVSAQLPKVLIFQVSPQEWADALKLGFFDGLSAEGLEVGRDITVLQRSAASDPQALTGMGQIISRENFVVVYALGTQAAQEVFHSVHKTPIIFGAVTDPIKAGFYDGSLTRPRGFITGTQDLWPYSAQFDLIKQLVPHASRIGALYNSNEVNSQVSMDSVRSESRKKGLSLIEKTITDETQVQLAVAGLLDSGIDVMFIPADNTAQGNSQVILAACERKNVPVFTGIPGIVEKGALATVGTNYYELGKVNAKQAAKIIRGIQIKEVPVATADRGDIYINLATAKKLNISVPVEIIKKAFKVYE